MMEQRTGYVGYALFGGGDSYKPLLGAAQCVLLDAEKRLVQYPGGDVMQIARIGEFCESEHAALEAAAKRMEARIAELQAVVDQARARAAELAAKASVAVCST